MKNVFDAYMANKKITIPVTILVAVLLVGGIAWGVSATKKDEPTVTASKEVNKITDKNGATTSTDKKDNKAASDQNDKSTSEDKATSDKKNDTKATATGKVTDIKKEDKKDTSKKENTSNNSANNNQQTPTEPETPAETYDSYNRPMSCSSTFFNTYAGLPAWKENGNVCYYRNGVKVVKSQSDYDICVRKYNDGIRDCPVCGAELNFAYVSTLCNPSDEHYGTDAYSCFTCGYAEYRPHVHVPGCAEHNCPL